MDSTNKQSAHAKRRLQKKQANKTEDVQSNVSKTGEEWRDKQIQEL
jgi:hypothetical protein